MKLCKQCNCEILKSQNTFCSRTCSATYNNTKYPKRKCETQNNCLNCGLALKKSSAKYCSVVCQRKYQSQLKLATWVKNQNFELANSRVIKKYLTKIQGHLCNICKIETWIYEGKEVAVPLILDHIDGNSDNQNFNNLRLVCGICDMLLPTYKGKNKGAGTNTKRQIYRTNYYHQNKNLAGDN